MIVELRGAPENVGEKLEAIRPAIRTNPVTGWKSIIAVGHHVHINDLAPEESKALLDWFVRLIVDNHDLRVRHRWQNANDLAIVRTWQADFLLHSSSRDLRAS